MILNTKLIAYNIIIIYNNNKKKLWGIGGSCETTSGSAQYFFVKTEKFYLYSINSAQKMIFEQQIISEINESFNKCLDLCNMKNATSIDNFVNFHYQRNSCIRRDWGKNLMKLNSKNFKGEPLHDYTFCSN